MTKRARVTFAKTGGDGSIVVVRDDEFYEDDHPYVKAWPEMFGDLDDLIEVHHVEQATAAPGEVRRGPGRPRKDSYQ
jgi:hypothetical protein